MATPGANTNAKGFTFPTLSPTLTLTDYYEFHGETNPDHQFGYFRNSDGSFKYITWKEQVNRIHHVGRRLMELLPPPQTRGSRRTRIVSVGLLRAGYALFPLSPRNSAAALAYLLDNSNCDALVVGRAKNLREVAKQAVGSSSRARQMRLVDVPSVEDLFERSDHDQEVARLPDDTPKPRPEDLIFMLHSSGSTGFPKVIPWNHQNMHATIAGFTPNEVDAVSRHFSVQMLPGHHTMGFLTGLLLAPFYGLTLPFFDPADQQPAITPEKALSVIDTYDVDYVMVTPLFLEKWSENKDAMRSLSKLKFVIFGGAPLSPTAARSLIDNSVAVHSAYGSTEASILCELVPRAQFASEWEWNLIPSSIDFELEYQSGKSGPGELILKSNRLYQPCVITDKEKGIYRTGDLVICHPEERRLIKVLGRADSQIIHSNGEKTSPRIIEDAVRANQIIKDCILFGQGRVQAGLLIEPVETERIDSTDEKALAAFRAKVWQAVETANQLAPQHSRIFKEMIIVASPAKPFTYVPVKETLNRKKIFQDYEAEIDSAYTAADTSSFAVDPPSDWRSIEDVKQMVRSIVEKVMCGNRNVSKLADDADLFQNGCDRQAKLVFNQRTSATRYSTCYERELSARVEFIRTSSTTGTISSLASAVCDAANPNASPSAAAIDPVVAHVTEMKKMIEKYSAYLTTHRKTTPNGDGPQVLSFLFSFTLCLPTRKIYALNRKAKGRTLVDRQAAALADKGFDSSILSEDKIVLVEAELEEATLGLSDELIQTIRETATLYIHNAWRLDFNIPLSTFEPYVRGTVNLINLALSAPPPTSPVFLFTSSVAVFTSHARDSHGSPPDDPIVDLASAYPMGYGESKLVSEKIIETARDKLGLRAMVIRLGQMSGSETNGAWLVSDWVPILVKSSISLGCLPERDDDVTWLSVTSAASTILSLRHAPHTNVNLTHPRPSSWSDLISDISKELGVPLVPYPEWVHRLSEAASAGVSPEEVPAVKLLAFFGELNVKDDMAIGKAYQSSREFRELKKLGIEDVRKWLFYWRSRKFIGKDGN